MRRTLIISSLTALALTAPLASVAASAPVVVDGDRFAARNISVLSQGCVDPGTSPENTPQLQIVRPAENPIYGEQAVRWSPATDGFGVGPVLHVDRPIELLEHAVTVYSPNSLTRPVAVATFVEPGRTGIWKGTVFLPTDTFPGGFHDITVPSTTEYQWIHFDGEGVQDDAANSAMTLRDFVNDRGGNNEGASVGVLFGCDGDTVVFDAIKYTIDQTDTRIFDFEGTQTTTALRAGKATVKRGQKVSLQVALRTKATGKAINGPVAIFAKQQGTSTFRKIGQRSTGGDGMVSLTVRPSKTTTYRASYAGTVTVDGSSDVVRIKVRGK